MISRDEHYKRSKFYRYPARSFLSHAAHRRYRHRKPETSKLSHVSLPLRHVAFPDIYWLLIITKTFRLVKYRPIRNNYMSRWSFWSWFHVNRYTSTKLLFCAENGFYNIVPSDLDVWPLNLKFAPVVTLVQRNVSTELEVFFYFPISRKS